MRVFISKAANAKTALVWVALFGFAVSCLWCFVFFPKAQGPYHLVLDSDFYGKLGWGIWKYHTFSYYPDHEPTLQRGPLYPAFVALALTVTHGWYPQGVQLFQCLVAALLCAVVFWTARALWSREVALVAGLVCAVHPMVFWWTSRIWLETLATFLFTAIVAASLAVSLSPTKGRAALLGLAIGLGAMCKSTLLPLLVLVPLLLYFWSREKPKPITLLLTVVVAALVITPWAIRNWKLTDRFIPVHSQIWMNVLVGDSMVDNALRYPLNHRELLRSYAPAARALEAKVPRRATKAMQEVIRDDLALQTSLSRYRGDPAFVFKKLAIDGIWFWMLGETPKKSLVLAAFQIPLFILFLAAGVVVLRRRQFTSIYGLHLTIVMVYYLAHLSVIAQARFSSLIVPTMLIYVVGVLVPSLRPNKGLPAMRSVQS